MKSREGVSVKPTEPPCCADTAPPFLLFVPRPLALPLLVLVLFACLPALPLPLLVVVIPELRVRRGLTVGCTTLGLAVVVVGAATAKALLSVVVERPPDEVPLPDGVALCEEALLVRMLPEGLAISVVLPGVEVSSSPTPPEPSPLPCEVRAAGCGEALADFRAVFADAFVAAVLRAPSQTGTARLAASSALSDMPVGAVDVVPCDDEPDLEPRA